jgi:two-component system, sensor histidine kinase and response regulator
VLVALRFICLCLLFAIPFASPAQVEGSFVDTQNEKDTAKLFKKYVALIERYLPTSPDTAALLSKQLILLSQDAGKKGYEVFGHYRLGDTYYDNGNYLLAISEFEKAVDLEKDLGKKNTSALFNDIGRAYRRLGNHAKALDYFFKAVDISIKNHDIGLEATLYNNIALVFGKDGNDSLALQYYFKSLKLHGQVSDSAGVALCYNNIGSTYQDLGRIEEAKKNFEKALLISKAIKDKKQLAFTYSNLGDMALQQKNYQATLSYFTLSKKYYEEIHVVVYVAEALLRIAEAHHKLGKVADAISEAKQALATGHQIQSPELISEAAQLLFAFYKEQNDFKQSLFYLETANKANEQFQKRESKILTDGYNARFELEKKQIEVIALEKELKLEQALEQRERIINYILIAGSLGLVTLVIVLRNLNRKKQRSNSLLQQTQQTIKAQNVELKKLGGIKDKLFSIMAHDFRAPLASLNGLMPLLKGENLSEQEKSFVLTSVSDQLSATTYFLENLLQWSRNQFSAITPKLETINAMAISQECVELLNSTAAVKKITIANNVTDCLILADSEMLKFIFRNLISNAIKFSHVDETITIQSKQVDKYIHFSIIDKGIGMSKEAVDQLFQLETVVTSGTKNERGTGLGLMLCRDFVMANGGTIWVESKMGEGSVFSFSLPPVKI